MTVTIPLAECPWRDVHDAPVFLTVPIDTGEDGDPQSSLVPYLIVSGSFRPSLLGPLRVERCQGPGSVGRAVGRGGARRRGGDTLLQSPPDPLES